MVVCDGDEIVGILVDSDVLRANDLNARVRDVMSTDFARCTQTPPYVRPET